VRLRVVSYFSIVLLWLLISPAGTGSDRGALEHPPVAVDADGDVDDDDASVITPGRVAVIRAVPAAPLLHRIASLKRTRHHRARVRALRARTGSTPAHAAHGASRPIGARRIAAEIRRLEVGLIFTLVSGALLAAALSRFREAVDRDPRAGGAPTLESE
jgi:hypothetical protein